MAHEFTNKFLFEDVDILGETIRDWDLEINQLKGGCFNGLISQVGRDGWIVGRAKFSQATGQKGLSPAGMRTVVIAGTPSSTLFWRNHSIGNNELMVFPRSRELDAVGYRNFHVLTLSFQPAALAAQIRGLGVALPDDFLDQAEVVQVDPADMVALRQRLNLVLKIPDSLHQDRIFLPSPLKILARVLVGSTGSRLPNSIRNRDRALTAAVKELQKDILGTIPIHSLSTKFGVSRRTLDAVFKEELGVTAGVYRKAIRLNRVHRHLRRADPNLANVKDIAQALGFGHLSQFAKDYHAFFGLLPSESLQLDHSKKAADPGD